MLALTIWQPWASLIAAEAKPFEWRGGSYLDRKHYPSGPKSAGLRIAIHAGARKVQRGEVQWLIRELESGGQPLSSLRVEVALPLLHNWLVSPGMLPLSSMLCTAVLGEPISAAEYARRTLNPNSNDSDRIDHSKWGWPLSDIELLQPFVPAKGARGFWPWIG